MDAADRHEHIANLRARDVFGHAVRVYRREPARVAGAALVLMVPPVVAGVGAEHLIERWDPDVLDGGVIAVVVIAVLAGVLTSVGTIVYAGVLDELVGSVIRGAPRPSVSEAVRSLPIGLLIGADLVAAVLVGAALALGVLPGLVLAPMLAIVGPVVTIERRRPFRAVARSMRLTVRHLGLTVMTVGTLLLAEGLAHEWLLHVREEVSALAELIVAVPSILTIGAFVGLVEVELAYALLARDPGSTTHAMVTETAGSPGKDDGTLAPG
jgi:hypothetical protein